MDMLLNGENPNSSLTVEVDEIMKIDVYTPNNVKKHQ